MLQCVVLRRLTQRMSMTRCAGSRDCCPSCVGQLVNIRMTMKLPEASALAVTKPAGMFAQGRVQHSSAQHAYSMLWRTANCDGAESLDPCCLQVIQETEAAYLKILESSQTLLTVLKRESINIQKKRQATS